MPICFRTDISAGQVMRCLQYCTAWGVDVVNMSFSMTHGWNPLEAFFPTESWNQAFTYATTVGDVVIVVAAAH